MRYIPMGSPNGPALVYTPRKRPMRLRLRRLLLLFLPLFLIGCGAYERQQTCRAEVGPVPYAYAGAAGGLIGELIVSQTPERQTWAAKFDACDARLKAASVAPAP